MVKTWEELESVDDLIVDGNKELIKKVEREFSARCPHLKIAGDYFYYCAGGLSEDVELELEPFNPIVSAGQGVAQLQLHCMDRYEACCHYNGSLPFPCAGLVE